MKPKKTDLRCFARRLGYTFKDQRLLQEALIHSSWRNENPQTASHDNERLEFLGDAVLQLAVTTELFNRFPEAPEGVLTRKRAEIVSEPALAYIARSLDLGAALWLGKGEASHGGNDKESILSDAMEAVLGAVYCDGGYAAAAAVVLTLINDLIADDDPHEDFCDYKTQLQEHLQAEHGRLPLYLHIDAQGPDHSRLYTAEVRFDGQPLGRGEGRSKKQAQQNAACAALNFLGKEVR